MLTFLRLASFPDKNMSNETVLISGSARRLGRAMALHFARAGASVAITYRTSQEEAQQLVKELREMAPEQKFAAFYADVSRAEDVETLKTEALQTFGSVTALVNNAAIFRRTPFDVMNENDFDDHIAANLKGPYLMSKTFGDLFLQQQYGSILNIADIYGLRPLKNYIPYCVSKAGVVMLTQALAKALAPYVRVNCICPGTILLPSEVQGGQGDDEDFLFAHSHATFGHARRNRRHRAIFIVWAEFHHRRHFARRWRRTFEVRLGF